MVTNKIARKVTTVGNSLGITLPVGKVEPGKYYKITYEEITDIDELLKLQMQEREKPVAAATTAPRKGMGKAGELRPKKDTDAPARMYTPYSGVISLDVADDGELSAALGGARHYYGVDEEEVSQ